jgi:NTE family protein
MASPEVFSPRPPRIGLVLGAGGLLGGAWLAGSLAAMADELGWDPASADLIVGTSAGSMIGALVAGKVPPWFMAAHSAGENFPGLIDATGRPTDEASRSAGGVLRPKGWPRLRPGSAALGRAALRHPRLHRPAAAFTGWLPEGVMSTRPLKETVRTVVPSGWVDSPRLWVVATDYATGRRVCFGRAGAPTADLADAVAASCAVPGLYQPQRIGDRVYVDGGAWSLANLDAVAGEDLDLVICLSPMSSRPEELMRAGKGRVTGALRRSAGRRLGWEARRLRERGTQVVLLQALAEDLKYMRGNMMSTARRHAVLETSRRTMRQQLADSPLPALLGRLEPPPEYRLRCPAGPPQTWPSGALPPGARVAAV